VFLTIVLLCAGGGLRADDDDCEDLEREPCDTGQPGICAEGHFHCRDGELECHREHDPRTEDCDNGLDDDCDGATDGSDSSCGPPSCRDDDDDGWAVCSGGCVPSAGDSCGDCDDSRRSVNPGRAEDCDNGRDDDCDGATDGQDPGCGSATCPDADGDGWAVCAGSCDPAGGDRCGDCDDGRAGVNPDRAEQCNGRDDDCDGSTDEGNPGGGGACSTGQSGICAAGTTRCTSGSLRCERNLAPRTEDCDNGLDDDCDGTADLADSGCRPDCGSATDGDSDSVADCADNCPSAANGGQQDFDGDGLGDACETGARLCDIDRTGRVDGVDLSRLGRAFGISCGQSGYDREADLTRDCHVDGDDLALLASLFGQS
jgi:hypothetical protein